MIRVLTTLALLLPLPALAQDWTVALAGELRERAEWQRNPVFGLTAAGSDSYLLQRLALSADIRRGDELGLRVQLVDARAPGWAGAPPATQRNRPDLHQLAADWRLPGGGPRLRLGRQELSFGSSRLVSVRESPNRRRAFDGLRLSWGGEGNSLDAVALRPVLLRPGAFDDAPDGGQLFWGLYGTRAVAAVPGLSVDAYYLGLRRANARFAQGTALERRHSVGVRLFGARGSLDWNVEAAWQAGRFGAGAIRAWTVSLEAGVTLAGLPWSPRLGINADAISGDGNPGDGRLGTFNPLYPKLPYFSEANLATPANLLDLQPGLTLSPRPDLTLTAGWNPLWKQRTADAFYAPPLVPVRGTAGSGRYIGRQLRLGAEWQPLDGLTLAAAHVRFSPGAGLRRIGGRAGRFTMTSVQVRF